MQKQAGKVAWQLLYRDCAFPMAGSSIVTNPMAPGDQYALARALHILLLLQAAPLKCVLVQTRHSVPDSRASPSRCVNETIHTPLRTNFSNYTAWKWQPEKKNHNLAPELAAYTLTRSFSYASHQCGRDSLTPNCHIYTPLRTKL